MDADQIQAWAREADAYADRGYSPTAKRLRFRDYRWHQKRDTHFARLVAAAALEEAAKVCHEEHSRDDLTGDYRYGAGICESRLRALAAAEKEASNGAK